MLDFDQRTTAMKLIPTTILFYLNLLSASNTAKRIRILRIESLKPRINILYNFHKLSSIYF